MRIYKYIAGAALVMVSVVSAAEQNKGMSFQAVLRDPEGRYPTASGLTATLQILDPVSNCVLREEEHSGVNISDGYINLVIGSASASTPGDTNPSPLLSLKEVMDNSKPINGFNCTYTPSAHHGRKLRLYVKVPRATGGAVDEVIADFNMRAVAYAVNSETLNGKSDSQFINVNESKNLNQENVESIFNRFTKLDAILNGSNGSGTTLGVNITGNAATATNVTGTVAITNGGTGATTQAAARTNLGLGSLATLSPTGTANGSTYLRGDGTWATVTGGVSSVAGKGGDVTLEATDITDFNTAADARITNQKGQNSGLASLNASGKVPSTQLSLVDTDIPNLDAAKITTGTIAESLISGLSVDKVASAPLKYFTYKPNNVACADNEVLKYDSLINLGAGGWKCATDAGPGTETDPTVQNFAKNAPSTGLSVNGSSQLVVSYGTTAGTAAQGNDSRITGAFQASTSLTGDASGTLPNISVNKIRGYNVLSTAPEIGGILTWNNNLSAYEAKALPSCSSSETLYFNSGTDSYACAAINNLNANKITAGTLDYARLPAGQAANTIAAGDDTRIVNALQKDGSVAATGHLNMGGKNINNVGTPIANTDAATKEYVDAAGGSGAGYSISCMSIYGNTGYVSCVRINQATGDTECRYATSAGGTWSECPSPFTVAAAAGSSKYIVRTQGSWTGNLGGLAGANNKCLTDLQTYDWRGKSTVTLSSSNVKALLCDSTTCQNLQSNTAYILAVSGEPYSGGASYVVDSYGYGPNNADSWGSSKHFNNAAAYWAARDGAGTTQIMPTTPGGAANCSNWTSTSGSGRTGYTGANDQTRWSYSTPGCSDSYKLLCIVE
ncbi:hypothetical protein [Bdellovibrio sp.]|uniref:hypothetical protein n=1 Tax=Bdellovibrio sp. TaxID=28201 RepID=UPI0039E58D47